MLIITGTIAYDYIMDFPGAFADHILPDQIHKINISFTAEKFEKRPGGTAGNVSYNLGLLGTDHILFSAAGKDFEDYKTRLKTLNINLSHVMEDESSYTDSGFAMTDKKNNQIWGYFYGATKKTAGLKLASVAKKGDFVLIGPSGREGTLSLLKQTIDLRLDYLFDPGFLIPDMTDEELHFGIAHATYIVGNDYEIEVLRKRISDWEKITRGKILITTFGDKGSKVQENGKVHDISAAKPTSIIDPTGAGDAWRAGFLSGMSNTFDTVKSARLASVVASFAVESYGAQEHSFTKKDIEDRYRQTFNDLLEF